MDNELSGKILPWNIGEVGLLFEEGRAQLCYTNLNALKIQEVGILEDGMDFRDQCSNPP